MNRIFGAVVIGTWLVAMTFLVRRDVLPFWSAQQAPSQIAPDRGSFQVAIRNEAGVRIGTTWITATPTENITTIQSTTLLDLRAIASILPLRKPLLCNTRLTYLSDGKLDQFSLKLKGAPIPIQVDGERCGPDFACSTTFGGTTKTVSLDGRLSECLAETLRPFTHLKGLHVGQRWRIRLLDPFSLLREQKPVFKMQLVTVTEREAILHNGDRVDCFRIETEGTVAWADDTGRVLRQEVQIPLLGRWILTDEPFDWEARKKAMALDRGEQGKDEG